MTPTEQAVERIKIALAYGDGTPLGDTYPLTHNMTAGDVSALLSALAALQTRAEDAERDRDAARTLRLAADAKLDAAEFLLALVAAAAERVQTDPVTTMEVLLAGYAEQKRARFALQTRVGELEQQLADESASGASIAYSMGLQLETACDALDRIAKATPFNTNSASASRMASWTQAVASTALASLTPPLELGK